MTDVNETICVLFLIISLGSWFFLSLPVDGCLLKKRRDVVIKATLRKFRRTGAVSDPF
jgi:hypothetical protein